MNRSREQGFSHVLLFLLFIVIVGAIGFTGLRVYQLQRSGQEVSSNSKDTQATEGPCAYAKPAHVSQETYTIVKTVCSTVAQKYTVDPGKFDDPVVTQANHIKLTYDSTNNDAPIWQLAGDGFSIYNDSNIYGFVLEAKIDFADDAGFSATKALSAAFIKSLESQGLHKVAAPFIPGPNDDVYYTNSTTVCSASGTTLFSDTSANGLSVSCADTAAYQPVAAALRPLMSAYFQKYPEKKGHTLETAVIHDSKTAGYRYSEGPIADSYPKVWAYEKNGTWHFLELTENGLNCDMSEYPADVRLAFLGTTCMDANNPPDYIGTVK